MVAEHEHLVAQGGLGRTSALDQARDRRARAGRPGTRPRARCAAPCRVRGRAAAGEWWAGSPTASQGCSRPDRMPWAIGALPAPVAPTPGPQPGWPALRVAAMDDDSRVGALRTATAAMAATVRAADPHAPVPACPGWDVTDLVDHLGRVHLWAAHCARHGSPPDPYPRRDREQPLPDWYAARADTIVDHRGRAAARPPRVELLRRAGSSGRPVLAASPAARDDDPPRRRAAGRWSAAPAGLVDHLPDLTTEQAADGVAEVFEVMAPRSLVRNADRPAPGGGPRRGTDRLLVHGH